ncbi:MAG TPA: pyridoxamine 5'-phosphate oxidase family protein [Candidatus Saccharimonadales bacterium]|nr:pyridoxamine 5'-phosphate oxidase family protein [Candidatus Saccharimonadales bacterium]
MSGTSKQELVEFMEKRFLCVLSTVNKDGRPESAFVGYVSSRNQEIIIGTSNKSRKFKNITGNKSVAVVIADQTGEVQYEGQAEVLTGLDYESLVSEGRFGKLPGLDKYRNDPTQVYLLIKPTWIRFILHGEADQITEFTEFA